MWLKRGMLDMTMIPLGASMKQGATENHFRNTKPVLMSVKHRKIEIFRDQSEKVERKLKGML
jgi:hypothetical protein